MANPLPNEDELYERIKQERITVAPEIWDLLYNRIGDDVSSIHLLCRYYFGKQEPIPIVEAKKIISYTHHIKDITNQVTLTKKDDFPFPEFLDDIPLHPILREMFTHYIGNDVYAINLIVQDSILSPEPEPISLDNTQKILGHTHTIKEFMDRLREATQEAASSIISNSPDNQRELSKEEIFFKIRRLLAKEFEMPDEEKIKPESRFREDLGLDSIDAIRVIMCLEEGFSLELPDDAADGIFTVAQTVAYITKRLRKIGDAP